MQKIEYTCDWCHERIDAKRVNQLSVRPVSVPVAKREPLPAEAEDEFLEIAQRLKAMMAHDKERDRRSLAADICDSCFAQLRRSIETQGMRR